jgi:hypothetical protein
MFAEERCVSGVTGDEEPASFALDNPAGVAAPGIAANAGAPVFHLNSANQHVASRCGNACRVVPAKFLD